MGNVNILLVGFHKIIRDSLKIMFHQHKEIQVIGEADSENGIIELCQNQKVDLIILNVDSAGINSIKLSKKLTDDFPGLKILALATVQKDQHIRQLFQAGASGYILKDSDFEELFKAINTIQNGSLYFSKEVTQAVMHQFIKNEEKRQRREDPFSLTKREVEILKLIVSEFTNQEIAEKLSISVRTVESHRRNLLQKTGSRNTAGLVRYAMEKKLFSNLS